MFNNRDFDKLFDDFEQRAGSKNTASKEDFEKLFEKIRNSRTNEATIIMKKTTSGALEIRINANTVDAMFLIGMLIFQMSGSDDEAEVIFDGAQKAYELIKRNGVN